MTSNRLKNLDRLLSPKHVAVFGGKDAEIVINQCIKRGFKGEIWPVNPKRSHINGIKCFSSVKDLPTGPDASFIAVPREPAIEIVRELNLRKAGGGVCYTAGFKEVGKEGVKLEKKLMEVVGDFALVGPNCYGIINYVGKTALWPFDHGGEYPGFGAAIITQSGMLSNDLSTSRRSMPFAYMISAGNQSALTLEDYVEYFCQKDEVKAIGLHIEGLKDVQKFQKVCLLALKKFVPIVAIKTGTSQIGNSLVNSHTGSLSGTDDIYNALFKHLGIIRVTNPHEFLETLKFLCISGPVKGSKVAGFTCSGGGATMLADYAEKLNLDFIQPSRKTEKKLEKLLPLTATVSNPLDYTTPIWGIPEKTRPVFDTFFEDSYNSAILVQDYLPSGINELNKYYLNDAKEFFGAAQTNHLPSIICCTVPENNDPEINDYFVSQKVTPMQGLEEALNAIKRSLEFYNRHQDYLNNEVMIKDSYNEISKSPKMLDEVKSKKILRDAGLTIPNYLETKGYYKNSSFNSNDIVDLKFPLCLKMLSTEIEHKSDVGSISLNIESNEKLKFEFQKIKDNVCKAQNKIEFTDEFLIEEMQIQPTAELLIGIFCDPQFGYVMTIASGGIFTNLLEDSITLLLPATPYEIDKAISSLKINKLLLGYRGDSGINRNHLIKNLVKLSNYVIDPLKKIHQLEINPLFVYKNKTVAVDAIIWIK
mgnify:CR=1 FL=1